MFIHVWVGYVRLRRCSATLWINNFGRGFFAVCRWRCRCWERTNYCWCDIWELPEGSQESNLGVCVEWSQVWFWEGPAWHWSLKDRSSRSEQGNGFILLFSHVYYLGMYAFSEHHSMICKLMCLIHSSSMPRSLQLWMEMWRRVSSSQPIQHWLGSLRNRAASTRHGWNSCCNGVGKISMVQLCLMSVTGQRICAQWALRSPQRQAWLCWSYRTSCQRLG